VSKKSFYIKSIFPCILFLVIPLILQAQNPSTELIDKIGRTEATSYLKSTLFTENYHYADYDLIYQRMEWTIDPSVKYISGAVTSYIVGKVSILDTISFDLHQVLLVDSVKSHYKNLVFQHEGNKVNIIPERPIGLSETDSLTIFYHGIPDASGFGSFVQTDHNGTPVIWTLSEPYGAMEWWPNKQSLSDKIDSIDIVVTCPEMYRTASNGVLVSEAVKNGVRTMVWKHRHPIASYLVAIGVTNYAEYSDSLKLNDGKSIRIQNFVYPEYLNYATLNTPQTIEIMALYNRLFGLYPFADEKYGHAQFGWGGGMEHQTISFMTNFGFDLVAHELSHQWFGDYITLASWHDIWLNEGFATFVTGLAYQNILGSAWWYQWRKSLVERITSLPYGSVYVSDTTQIGRLFDGRLSYSKGGYLLHMLRWVMGDDHFFTAIRNYLNDPEIANGFATQEKLVKHLESAADTSLNEFFNDWYYGEGFPVYSVQYAQNTDGILKINLFQKTTDTSVVFFKMPVQVRCYNSNFSDSADFRLENTINGQEFFVDPGFQVASLKIDPELWLISKTEIINSVPWINSLDATEIYPNPVTEKLHIMLPPGENISTIEILTVSGKILRTFHENQKTVNFSGLPKGIYLVRISGTSGTTAKKIIKN
jgi:aminopeptidase N